MEPTTGPTSDDDVRLFYTIKILGAFASFVVCLAGGLLPLKLVSWGNSGRVLSFASCLSGGILLGASLVHMLADSEEQDFKYPLAHLLSGLGFLVAFFLEKVLFSHSHSHGHDHGHGHGQDHDGASETDSNHESAHGHSHGHERSIELDHVEAKRELPANDNVAGDVAVSVLRMEAQTTVESVAASAGAGDGTLLRRKNALNGTSPGKAPARVSGMHRVVLDDSSGDATHDEPPVPDSPHMPHHEHHSKHHGHPHLHTPDIPADHLDERLDSDDEEDLSTRRDTHHPHDTGHGGGNDLFGADNLAVSAERHNLDDDELDMHQSDKRTLLGTPEVATSVNRSLPIMLFSVLSLESFVSGTALGIAGSNITAIATLIAIITHIWAESFALTTNILKANFQRRTVIYLAIAFAGVTPLGAAVGMLLFAVLQDVVAKIITAVFVAFAAGIFLYVAVVEIIVEEFEDAGDDRWPKLALLLIGYGFMSVLATVV